MSARTLSWLPLSAVLLFGPSVTAGEPWVVMDGHDGPGKGKHVVFLVGDEEYRSEESMPQMAKILAKHHGFKCTVLFAIDRKSGEVNPQQLDNIPGLEALADADLMVMFLRFRNLPDDQMKHVVEYLNSGKPIVALRTSTHAFRIPKEGKYYKYDWRSDVKGYEDGFGRQVLGETWVNHYGAHQRESTRGLPADGQKDHPILRGVEDVWGASDLYGLRDILGEHTPIVMGQVLKGMKPTDEPNPDKKLVPLAWTKTYTGETGNESKVFATTLGHVADFTSEGTRRLIVNACYWALGMGDKITPDSDVSLVGEFEPGVNDIGVGSHKKGVRPEDHALAPPKKDAPDPGVLKLNKGDKVVIIGNTLAERMQYFGHFETTIHARFSDLNLEVRNLGWSADEPKLRPRSKDFDDHGHTLNDHKPNVILAFFGYNESFAGEKGLGKFKSDLADFIKTTTTTKYNGESAPTLVLYSPIANENLSARGMDIGDRNNANIELYAAAMREVAAEHGVQFVDLFGPSLGLMTSSESPLTFNGCHLTDEGYARLAPVLHEGTFGDRPADLEGKDLSALRAAVNEKNLQFFYDYRAVNGYYIYGGRKEPFGVVNFPAEFAKLRRMIAKRDQRIWDIAQGRDVPGTVDDSDTGEFVEITTNVKNPVRLTPPDASLKSFELPEGFEISLFASEADFPELKNPTQFTFDAKGRLWVTTMPSYPMYLPGTPPDDKILVFEDTDGDGKADEMTVFADGLHVPTGLALGDGGVYVAQQPNLVFLKDTNGDGKADFKRVVLHGFDSADSHHSISAFEWGPGGDLYFQEGTFHHTQVETPYGPKRVRDAAVFRYEPRKERFDVFISYPFANPWGHCFDKWGQNFVADASPGFNYFAAGFSGDVIFPQKRRQMKQIFTKQWRPTCGCVIVSSRNFPDDMQGNYLINNTIGFLGTLNYKLSEVESGFEGEPDRPLLKSSDPNFRPVDLQFGPDGALYICDWFNPLIGHMQHSLRDPNRDTTHGRIWRIHNTNKPLVERPEIVGRPLPELLDLLRTYEDSTRHHVRMELRVRPTDEVMAAVKEWVKGIDESDESHDHLMLEALWVCQNHDVADEGLLKKVLGAGDPRARAAATRVLCYWRDHISDALELLRKQINDEHPRVRLEAVRALSFFDVPKAQEVAVEVYAHPMDDYLEYTAAETLTTLEQKLTKK